MATVTIAGIPAFDGTYELDEGYFTNRELHLIKQISGVRAGELMGALEAGDNDVMVALTVIAVRRSGRELPVDLLWDAPMGAVQFDFTVPGEGDVGPPEVTPNVNGSSDVGDGSKQRSGVTSGETGAIPVSDQSPIGARG